MTTPSKALDIVILAENRLGLTLSLENSRGNSIPLWKARMIESKKLTKKMAVNPNLYSFLNLELAIEYCRKKKIDISSTLALCSFVNEALRVSAEKMPTTSIDKSIALALIRESEINDSDSEYWTLRLQRVDEEMKENVYDEWREARR